MTKHSKGFLFLAEAALSVILLASAFSFLPLFSSPSGNEADALACSDAAGVLLKSGAFESQEKLERAASEANGLSSLCIEASAGALLAGSCAEDGEAVSFSFPIWQNGGITTARVSCRLR